MHTKTKKIQKEYSELAHKYDDHWHDYLEATHKHALEMLDPEKSDRILDASAGTGLLAGMIRRKVPCELSLIDISGEMLSVARNRFTDDSRIHIRKMDVHALDFPDAYFSKIVCLNAFHFYAYPEKVLSEFHRVLKKSGKLVMVAWCRDPWHFRLFDAAMRITQRPYVRSHTSGELQNLLEKSEFTVAKSQRWSHRLWSLINIVAEK